MSELDAVKRAARRYAKAQAVRDAALAELQAAIRAADDAGGVTRKDIIAAAGVAKQTVYDALRKA